MCPKKLQTIILSLIIISYTITTITSDPQKALTTFDQHRLDQQQKNIDKTLKELERAYKSAHRELDKFKQNCRDVGFYQLHTKDIKWPFSDSRYLGQWLMKGKPHDGMPIDFFEPDDREHAPLPKTRRPLTCIEMINPQVGYGLKAAEEIEANTPVAPYTGEMYEQHPEHKDNLLYGIQLTDRCIVDAEDVGNEARFANHSFAPNATITFFTCPITRHIQPWLTTTKKISTGEEIRWNYGIDYWKILKQVPQEDSNNRTIAMLTDNEDLQEHNIFAYADNTSYRPGSEACLFLRFKDIKNCEIGLKYKTYPQKIRVVKDDPKTTTLIIYTGFIDGNQQRVVLIPVAIQISENATGEKSVHVLDGEAAFGMHGKYRDEPQEISFDKIIALKFLQNPKNI